LNAIPKKDAVIGWLTATARVKRRSVENYSEFGVNRQDGCIPVSDI
jgi:hypothetical protein